jgi:hypothetical protein
MGSCCNTGFAEHLFLKIKGKGRKVFLLARIFHRLCHRHDHFSAGGI